MTAPIADANTYADFAGLAALKNSAKASDPAALRKVAQQFESLFARIMIKSMRDAVGTDPIFCSDQEKMYQGMFDDQLSVELTKGKGLGLADMLVQQLQRSAAGSAATGTTSASGATAAAQALAPQAAASAVSQATQTSFIQDVWPHAQAAGEKLGVDPRTLVAQAALETNWGTSVPQDASGRSSNNLFGVKAAGSWTGGAVSSSTSEFENGAAVRTTAPFRAYASRAQSFEDYVELLRSSPRYAPALNTGNNVHAFATALQQGGYATDPDYASKVSRIADHMTNVTQFKSAAPLPISTVTAT